MSLFHCGDSMRNAWFCSPHCCYPSSVGREREHSGTLLSTPIPPQRVHVHTHTHTYTRSHLPTHAHTFPGTFLSLTLCWDILSLPRRWPPPFHLHKCCSITGGWQIKGKKTNNNIRCPAMVLRPKRDKGRASIYLSSDSLPLWGYFGGNIWNNMVACTIKFDNRWSRSHDNDDHSLLVTWFSCLEEIILIKKVLDWFTVHLNYAWKMPHKA